MFAKKNWQTLDKRVHWTGYDDIINAGVLKSGRYTLLYFNLEHTFVT